MLLLTRLYLLSCFVFPFFLVLPILWSNYQKWCAVEWEVWGDLGEQLLREAAGPIAADSGRSFH